MAANPLRISISGYHEGTIVKRSCLSLLESRPRKAPKKLRDDTLKAFRLWLGSVDYVRPKDEERLHRAAVKKLSKLLKAMGLPDGGYTFMTASEQMIDQANSVGLIRPVPGRDI